MCVLIGSSLLTYKSQLANQDLQQCLKGDCKTSVKGAPPPNHSTSLTWKLYKIMEYDHEEFSKANGLFY